MKRKTFEEWFKYRVQEYRGSNPASLATAFHANDEYIDHQAKRIAELEEKIKSLDFQYEELMERRKQVRELERQNALLEECRAFYGDDDNWEDC